jgi:hypothetical protein
MAEVSRNAVLTNDEGSAGRYSPPRRNPTRRSRITGHPDPRHVSTSYEERVDLHLRWKNHRHTRLTNRFSQKIQSLEHSLSVGSMVYNFVRRHGTIRVSPAMAAGVTERLWSSEDVIEILEAREESAADVARRRKDRTKSN